MTLKPPSDSTGKWLGFLIAGLCIALALFAFNCQSAVITDSFLDRVAVVESNGKNVVGDDGLARGYFQLHFAAWIDASEYRQSKGLPIYPYSDAMNYTVAKLYAKSYLELLSSQLAAATGKKPTIHQLYACYCLGFTGFKRCGFSLSRVPMTVKRAIKKL